MNSVLSFKKDLLPFLIATIGEFIALHYWLTYLELGNFILANILLWIGFGIERGSVAFWLQRVYKPTVGINNGKVSVWLQVFGWLFITFTEIVIWVIWYKCIPHIGHIGAGVVLYVLMLVEHSAEMGLVKGKNILVYTKVLKTHFYTLMETLGAMGWIYFHTTGRPGIGITCLIIGLSIEHIIQGGGLKAIEE